MKNKDPKKTTLQKKLLSWYKKHHRKLPWREDSNPYKIWISEVMLQQTTVKTVLPYYKKWMKLFPDVESLSKAPLQKILKAWQGLGYYTRAKNLHRASRVIVDKFNGQIPVKYNTLINLPGFGPYTTAAVLSLAFNQPYPSVDANVRRVLMRLKGLHGEANPKIDKPLLRFLKPYLPQKKVGFFNQALMELGALVCRPRNPLCLLCPITEFCRAFEEGKQEIIPHPKKKCYQKIEAVIAIIQEKGKYLIQKRPSQGLLADFWEFPGGKRKAGESVKKALHREIKEELSVDIQEEEFLACVNHAYTQFHVKLHAFECSLKGIPNLQKSNHKWVTVGGLRQYPLPSGSAKIVKILEEKKRKTTSPRKHHQIRDD